MKIQKLKESFLKEDASKEWKPNTSFKHVKDIYNKVKANNYKYVNNEREEFMAAVKKADNKGYKPEECRQIKDWHREIWQKNRKTEDIDYSQFRNMPDLIPYTPVEDNKKWQYSVGGVDVPYTSYEEAKAHIKDDYKITDYRNELQEYIDKETGRPHTFFVDETFDGRLCIDINHGDWKHEHWYADSLVKKFFMNKGLIIEIEEDVTLEDGSDTYSACHYYEIDDLMLSGRVVEESLKEDLTDPSEVIEFKKQLSIVDNLDDIQELITGLSDGVAEDLVQQAFDANEMKSIGEVKSAILSALDVYLEDNDWLGESLESNIKHIYYHNDPVTGLKKGQWVDVKEENGKLYGKWSFEGDDGWHEITNIEEMPYHNFHGARPAKTFVWGGWRHWLDDEVEKFWDIEGKRISGDFEIPGMPHVKRKLEDMNEATECKVRFYQVFEAPKSPKENGKMIGQRGTLKDAIAFGDKRTGGRNNFLVKAVCNDGTKKYVDFNLMSDDEINELSEALNENAFTDAMKIAGSVVKNTGKAIGNSVKNSALGQAVQDKVQAIKDSDLVKNIKDDVKQTDTYKKHANKDTVNKVKTNYSNYLKGVKSAPELFFNYLQLQNKAQDVNQLGIFQELSKELENVAKKNKINLLDTTNTIRQKINDKSISNITSKTDIQKFLTNAAYRGSVLNQWNRVYSKKFGTSAVTESIDDNVELNEESEGFEKEFYNNFVILKNRAGDGWDIYSYDGTPEKVTRVYLEDEGYATLQAAKDEIDKWNDEAKLDESIEDFADITALADDCGKNTFKVSTRDIRFTFENEDDKTKFVNELLSSNIPHNELTFGVVSINKSDALDESSYGGAFDIADDQYFTREDIETASEKVLDHVNETFTEEYVLGGTWFENGNWIVNVQTQDGMEEYEVKVPVSMRRIRKPSDIEKYVLEVASKLIAQIKEYNGLDEAFSGEYSDKFYGLAKDFEVDDDIQGLRVLADDIIRYCPEEDVKDCWYDRGYQKRQQDEEDRIAWLNSDDELDEDYNSVDGWEYQPAGHGSIPEYNKEYSDRLLGIIIPPIDEYTKYFAVLYDNSIADYIYSDLTRFDVDDESALFDSMEAAVEYLDAEASKALNNLNIKADDLNEDYDGESEKGPDEGADAGIADLLSTAIIDEWEAIKEYNDLAINARAEGFDDVATIIDDINTEENIHVGQLQQALTTISPNATVIDQGQQEARDQLSGGSASEIEDKVEIDDIDDDF